MKSERKDLYINISSATLFKALLVGILCVVVYYLRDLVMVVLSAVVIASVIEPATLFFTRHKVPRLLSVIIIYLILLITVSSFIYFLIPILLTDLKEVVNNVPNYIKTVDVIQNVHSTSFFKFKSFFPDIPNIISVSDLVQNVASSVTGFSGSFFDLVNKLFGGLFSAVLIVVLSFYFAVKENSIGEFLTVISPISQKHYIADLWLRAQAKIGRWMQGQLILGLIVVVFVYLGLLVLNIKHPLILALIAGVFELIPIVGMSLAGIPAVVLGFLDGGLYQAVLVAALYLIVQQLEAHAVYPLVVHKMVGVSPIVVIIALIAGAKLGGFLGALLSVPLTVALLEYVSDLHHAKMAMEKVEEVPINMV